jgi:mRNA interferase MazF
MPLRGEIWWCEVPEIQRRPVVVLSRDAAIPRVRRTLIGPCTTTIRNLPSEVVLEPGEVPINRRCAVNLDSVENVPYRYWWRESDVSAMGECARSALHLRLR